MQKTNAIIKKIKPDPPDTSILLRKNIMKFLILSGLTKPECWYSLNLSIKCYECKDRVSIYKHLFLVRKLVGEEIAYLKCMLHTKENRLINNFDDVREGNVVIFLQSPEPILLS